MAEQTDIADDPYQRALERIAAVRASGSRALSLERLELDTLPPEIGNLIGLQTLDLDYNRLSKLPDWLENLTGLQTLYISRNELRTLPDWLGKLTSLRRLYLRQNKLSTIPEWLGNLSSLQSLNLSENGLSTLPDLLGNLTNLQNLDLSQNRLGTLPESLGNLTNLQNLDLSQNRLRILPESLGNLTNLQTFDISQNGLSTLPEWLGNLSNLQALYLSGNNLSTLPEWLGNLSNLRTLYLAGNGLSTLPDWLGDLSSLHTLYLAGNRLSTLPERLGKLTGLQAFYLGGNGLSTLPEWLRNLTNLQTLDLSGNGLSTLPKWLRNLTNLQTLDLSGNGLSTLPDWLGNLTGLQGLDLSGNGLSTLPEWLRNLTGLQGLDLSRNELSTLPEWLGSLKLLEAGARDFPFEGLDVTNNLLPHPYPALVAPGQPEATANVLAYLRGDLNPAKLIEAQDRDNEDASVENLELITEQRPAAYRFGLRDGRIDAVPETAEPIDPDVAIDLLAELRDKTRDLTTRLAAANADPRVRRSVDRLHEALTDEPLRPGILLSRARSIEADRDAFDTPEGRAELFPDAIAHMNDVLLSLQDVLAVFPVVRRIDAERLALDIQSDAASLAMIAAGTDVITATAAKSDVVTPAAAVALTVNDAAIADATTLDVRAGLVADKLLIIGNLTREAIRAADRAEAALAETLPESKVQAAKAVAWAVDPAASEDPVAGELGRRIGREILDNLPQGVGDVARIAPMVAFTVLLLQLLGPLGLIAGFIPTFKPLIGAAKSLRSRRSARKTASAHEAATASPTEHQSKPLPKSPSRKVTARKGGARKTRRP